MSAPFYLLATPIPPPARVTRHALAAAALVLGMGSAAFALNSSWNRQRAAAVASAAPVASARRAKAPSAEAVALVEPPRPASSQQAPAPAVDPTHDARRPARSGTVPPKYGVESELMHRAHSSFAEGDFGATLKILGEHARRFPRGLLAEEREALRVRSLASAGRTAEARRAAQAFADHFPRSVLLARIQKLTGTDVERAR